MAKVMAKVREAVLSQSKLSQDISLVPCSSLISHHCQVLTPYVSRLCWVVLPVDVPVLFSVFFELCLMMCKKAKRSEPKAAQLLLLPDGYPLGA